MKIPLATENLITPSSWGGRGLIWSSAEWNVWQVPLREHNVALRNAAASLRSEGDSSSRILRESSKLNEVTESCESKYTHICVALATQEAERDPMSNFTYSGSHQPARCSESTAQCLIIGGTTLPERRRCTQGKGGCEGGRDTTALQGNLWARTPFSLTTRSGPLLVVQGFRFSESHLCNLLLPNAPYSTPPCTLPAKPAYEYMQRVIPLMLLRD